ncbi:phosphoserine phosphatase SerB [Rathayibacter soli]|uniref:phosphoserine phosphatase SerB n=1 Tax=Rathayibacter soli TaxID=3144168 RepID=UPI0027E41D5E|nr:phosphoserine phosphatase SerB [Glaciibacter superstes]
MSIHAPVVEATATTVPNARFLVVLDADSTLIHNEVIELLAEHAGSLDAVARITARAMHGELDFSESLRARVATLAGLPCSVFEAVADRIRVTDGAPALIEAVHAAGGALGVVSGGFHELLDPLGELLGLDFWQANRLELADGVLTGRVTGAIVDAKAKASAMRGWAVQKSIPARCWIAVGDGANDLEMMAEAALSVAFNAKPAVRRAADVVVDGQDLSQLLPLMGLRG